MSDNNGKDDGVIEFEDFKGSLVTRLAVEHEYGNDKPTKLTFGLKDGLEWRMFHESQCCEDVHIEDIEGDLLDLLASPISVAESVYGYFRSTDYYFYRLGTRKGIVTIRWSGYSVYYSTEVEFRKFEKKGGQG